MASATSTHGSDGTATNESASLLGERKVWVKRGGRWVLEEELDNEFTCGTALRWGCTCLVMWVGFILVGVVAYESSARRQRTPGSVGHRAPTVLKNGKEFTLEKSVQEIRLGRGHVFWTLGIEDYPNGTEVYQAVEQEDPGHRWYNDNYRYYRYLYSLQDMNGEEVLSINQTNMYRFRRNYDLYTIAKYGEPWANFTLDSKPRYLFSKPQYWKYRLRVAGTNNSMDGYDYRIVPEITWSLGDSFRVETSGTVVATISQPLMPLQDSMDITLVNEDDELAIFSIAVILFSMQLEWAADTY